MYRNNSTLSRINTKINTVYKRYKITEDVILNCDANTSIIARRTQYDACMLNTTAKDQH
eukprot:m.283545 g.283545  ORF g.283545 m.283545 type:complete len:59 (-) comp166030_c0_seq1:60-236(-)